MTPPAKMGAADVDGAVVVAVTAVVEAKISSRKTSIRMTNAYELGEVSSTADPRS